VALFVNRAGNRDKHMKIMPRATLAWHWLLCRSGLY
jgi:hypothetical protein